MNDISNKASICAIVHIEIIDFFKKKDLEQANIKTQLNSLINHAVIDVAVNNRAILNVADGTIIACIGPLEDALEDALLISLTIRDEILENNRRSSTPLYLRIGINLGPAEVSSDANGNPSIVGESIDEARRIMSFSKPNQILVSRPYYEMTSEISQEISQMFDYHDMHANEQDIYSVRLHKDPAAIDESPLISTDNSQPEKKPFTNIKINWNHVLLGLLVFVAFFVLAKQVSAPTEPTITLVQPPVTNSPVTKPPASTISKPPAMSDNVDLLPNESLEKPLTLGSSEEAEAVNKKVVQKKTKQKPVAATKSTNKVGTKVETKAEASKKTAEKTVEKPTVSKAEKNAEKDKSGWDTFKESVKQGTELPCSQAEIAMNQCHQ